jgi:DnaJ-class molecular chaperone
MDERDERDGGATARDFLRSPLAAGQPPGTPPKACAHCWGGRVIFEGGPLGLVPVVCGRCSGTGREPQRPC